MSELRLQWAVEAPLPLQVTFTREQWELVEKFQGLMANTDAEIGRNIVLAWLAEKSHASTHVKIA